MEAALYHKSCVTGADGRLKFPTGVSPITRKRVDGFLLMPSVSNTRAWVSFADWDCDGRLSVAEVAVVVSAILPVDESGAEDFVRGRWDKNKDGVIDIIELEQDVLPYLRNHAAQIVYAAPMVGAPAICSDSTKQEMLAWFQHWDSDRSNSLDVRELRYALVSCFFRALGDAPAETKEVVVEMFLEAADVDGDGTISKTEFIDRLVPSRAPWRQHTIWLASIEASFGVRGSSEHRVAPRCQNR